MSTERWIEQWQPDTRFIVSEPLRELPGAWTEVPEGSWARIQGPHHEFQPFEPTA